MTFFSDQMIVGLHLASYLAIGFSALLILDVVAIRFRRFFITWRLNRFIEKWTPPLKTYLGSASTHPPTSPHRKSIPWLILWVSLGRSTHGSTLKKLNILGNTYGLKALALKHLRGRSYKHKLIALTSIAYLGDPSMWSLVIPLAYSSNLTLSLRALETLIHLDTSQAAPFILEQFPKRPDWPITFIKELLSTTSPTLISEYVREVMQRIDKSLLPRLIPFLELLPQKDRTALLLIYMAPSTAPETLVACLPLVSQSKEMPLVRDFVTHGAWQVRAETAAALGRAGNILDKTLLDPLLCDPVWWVRQRSAEAIAHLPGIKSKDVREIKLVHPDLFVREAQRC